MSPSTDSLTIPWTDNHREHLFHTWLARVASSESLDIRTVRPASADASFRRYFRVNATSGKSHIIMDAPPDKENSEPFVRIAHLMGAADLRVPHVLDWCEAHGFMLLTDLGSQTVMQYLEANPSADKLPLFQAAIQALIQWQQASRPEVLPPYDEALLMRELQLFPDWYVGQYREKTFTLAQQATWDKVCKNLVAHNLSTPKVYVHRDFMLRNLMMRDAALGLGVGVGVLDFQDSVYGPITYDIASLVRDAFASWDEDFVLDVVVRYWQNAKAAGLSFGQNTDGNLDEDFGAFYKAVEWMGLQRHLKILGIFARLTLRDGKPKYLSDTPRFIHYVKSTAGRYRELKPLVRLIDDIEGTQALEGFAYGRM